MITVDVLKENARQGGATIKKEKIFFYFPAVSKKDKAACKRGDVVSEACSFLHFAHAVGFVAEYDEIDQSGTTVSVMVYT